MNNLVVTMKKIRKELGLAPCDFDGNGMPYSNAATKNRCKKELDKLEKKCKKEDRNRMETEIFQLRTKLIEANDSHARLVVENKALREAAEATIAWNKGACWIAGSGKGCTCPPCLSR